MLWGKGREASKIDEGSPAEATRESIEVVVAAQEAATDPGSGNVCDPNTRKGEEVKQKANKP